MRDSSSVVLIIVVMMMLDCVSCHVSNNDYRSETTCSTVSQTNGTDRPGSDYAQYINVNVSKCSELCCEDTFLCQSFVYVSNAPSDFGSCKKGVSCCYLKNTNVSAVPSTLPGIVSGTVKINMPSLKVKWNLKVSKGPAYTTSSPVLSDSKVFFGIGTSFFSVHRSNGSLAWSEETNGNLVATPMLYDSTVIFSSFDGLIRARDAETGEIEWTFDAHSFVESSPVLSDNLLIFGAGDGVVYALNVRNGSMIWNVNLNATIFGSGLVTLEKTVIFGSFGATNVLTSFEIESGDVVWSSDLNHSCSNGVGSNPVLENDGNVLYITCQRAGGHAHGGGNEAFAVAANVSTGETLRVIDLNSTALTMNPLIISDCLILSVDTEIVSISTSPSSNVLFRRHLGSSLSSPASSSDDTLALVASSQGDVFALDPKRGTVAWAFQGLESIFSSVLEDSGEVYVVTASSLFVLA